MKLRQAEKIFKRLYVADKENYWNGYTMNTIVSFTKFWRNHRLLKASSCKLSEICQNTQTYK